MQVSMIGLGKLGLPCAEKMSEKHTVKGYDVLPVDTQAISVMPSIKEAIEGSEIIFIAVPTPHDEEYDGRTPISELPTKDFNYSTVKEVLAEVRKHGHEDQDVVLISTVLPGTTRKHFAEIMHGFNFIYNPIFSPQTYFFSINPISSRFRRLNINTFVPI